jgi:hypothetical protein
MGLIMGSIKKQLWDLLQWILVVVVSISLYFIEDSIFVFLS